MKIQESEKVQFYLGKKLSWCLKRNKSQLSRFTLKYLVIQEKAKFPNFLTYTVFTMNCRLSSSLVISLTPAMTIL